MGSTANYSWPTPEATDLVKDGWEAIKDLGDAIDTTVFANSPGLIHINETTFSSSSAVSVDNVFSSTYTNYRIVVDGSLSASATGGTIGLRLRVGGADNSGTNYFVVGLSMAASSGTFSLENQTSAVVGYAAYNTGNSNWGSMFIDITKPNAAEWTHFYSVSNGVNASNQNAYLTVGAHHRVATAYDGFSLLFPAATTGAVRVYGYKK